MASSSANESGAQASRASKLYERVHVNTIATGQKVQVHGHVRFGMNCGEMTIPKMTMLINPGHGQIETLEEDVKLTVPNYGSGKCVGQTGRGSVVYYTRTSVGPDRFEYRMSGANQPAVGFDILVDSP